MKQMKRRYYVFRKYDDSFVASTMAVSEKQAINQVRHKDVGEQTWAATNDDYYAILED